MLFAFSINSPARISPLPEIIFVTPTIFDTVYINLIKGGEASGKLDVFLLKLVDSLEKREKVKKKIKSALT